MKTILLGAVAALALTSLPAVHAEDTSVAIKAPPVHRYYLSGEEFRPYRNTYLLENGQKITFKQRVSKLYAQLEDGAYTPIYAVAPTTFVTVDGTRFQFRDEGDTVAISDFQKLPLAKVDNPNVSVMMASAK